MHKLKKIITVIMQQGEMALAVYFNSFYLALS